jgi:broad specificity phosphatase PhoE
MKHWIPAGKKAERVYQMVMCDPRRTSKRRRTVPVPRQESKAIAARRNRAQAQAYRLESAFANAVGSAVSRPLLLIRHGQIGANVAGRWHGATDSPLTFTGRRQAIRLARRVHTEWGNLAAIYSSPLQRCRRTADAIAALVDQPVLVDDDLREYGIGELENCSFSALQSNYDFFRRIREDADYAPRGGDSVNAVAERIVRALQRIHARHETTQPIAVVSHGAALGIALAHLLDDDPKHWTNYQFDNCSITELLLEPEPLVAAFNRTEHL